MANQSKPLIPNGTAPPGDPSALSDLLKRHPQGNPIDLEGSFPPPLSVQPHQVQVLQSIEVVVDRSVASQQESENKYLRKGNETRSGK